MLGGPRMEEVVRRHRRYTVLLGVAFATNLFIIFPFFAGNPWHKYWREIGNPLLLLCLILWLGFLFEADAVGFLVVRKGRAQGDTDVY